MHALALALALTHPVAALEPCLLTIGSKPTGEIRTDGFFGSCHWPESKAKQDLFIPRMKEHGIRLLRIDIDFNTLLGEDVCPNLAAFQQQIRDPKAIDRWHWEAAAKPIREAKAAGFRTMGIYLPIPKQFTVNGSLPAKGDADAWKAFGHLCGIVAKRLNKVIDVHEINNETHFFLRAEQTGYARAVDADPDLISAAAPEIRRQIGKEPLLGMTTWVDTWAGSTLETAPYDPRITRKTLDFVSIHIYDTPIDTFIGRMDEARSILDGTSKKTPPGYDKRLKGTPLWITEWDFYWENLQVGMEWYGDVLVEMLKRRLNNCIYNYEETFDPKAERLTRPWKMLVECGLNAKSQRVRVLPVSESGDSSGLRTTAAALPDGSAVLLVANRSDQVRRVKLGKGSLTGSRAWVAEAKGSGISRFEVGGDSVEVPARSFCVFRL